MGTLNQKACQPPIFSLPYNLQLPRIDLTFVNTLARGEEKHLVEGRFNAEFNFNPSLSHTHLLRLIPYQMSILYFHSAKDIKSWICTVQTFNS